jgi:hypothetical protein
MKRRPIKNRIKHYLNTNCPWGIDLFQKVDTKKCNYDEITHTCSLGCGGKVCQKN